MSNTTVTVARIGNQPTICFAVDELVKYLKIMDVDAIVDQTIYKDYDGNRKDVLFVGISTAFEPLFSVVKDRELDDIIHIDVVDFCVIITGGNIRSVLLAVYRFLKELGAAWVRPGSEGELIPQRKLDRCRVNLNDTPSYRHRAVCIEGAVGYEHVYNIIDWLPKAGMNGYFIQFSVPYDFFWRWYAHIGNPTLGEKPFSKEDAARMRDKLAEDIELRSLMYHEVGHGWTCEPFGIVVGGWGKIDDSEIPNEKRELLAMVNGKRGLHEGVPMDTELCFSNPRVIDIIANAVVEYCQKHPAVSHLHLWLADSTDNHCECSACSTHRPSDWYVDLLNEVDRRLTVTGNMQHIVFCVYNDLLWAPITKRLYNQDRFVLMFAPITRNYNDSFQKLDFCKQKELPPYVRNKCNLPDSVQTLFGMVQNWQEITPNCDSFDFDYHLWREHLCDIGYCGISNVLFEDIQALHKMGMNGLVSCQIQRLAFPTNLPMEVMAATLWDMNVNLNTVTNRYFLAAFGERFWEVTKEYLENLSNYVNPGYKIGNKKLSKITTEKRLDLIRKAKESVLRFRSVIEQGLLEPLPPAQHRSWVYLSYHSEFAQLYLDLIYDFRAGKDKQIIKQDENVVSDWLNDKEPEIHRVFDIWRMHCVLDSGYYKQ